MMDKLAAMRLQGMMESLQQQQKDAGIGELSFLERLAMLSTTSGTGARIRRWPGGYRPPNCAATRVSRISIFALRADWTGA